jgi:CTP:molybdopterin cytidylyltransferase MocA
MLGRRHWPGVATTAVGDTGARAFLRTRTDVVEVECADVASGLDVDEPADLEAFGR